MGRERKEWTLTVQCGEGSHEVTIAQKGRGKVEIFSPCELLPETARKMAKSSCLENLSLWLINQLREGKSIPMDVALDALAAIGGKPMPLFKLLKDQEITIAATVLCFSKAKDGERYEAARELVNKGAIRVLVKVLREGDSKARYLAAEALGEVGGWRARKALEKALGQEESEWVRRRIAWSLGKIGDRRSIPSLVMALEREEREGVSWLIAEALGRIVQRKDKRDKWLAKTLPSLLRWKERATIREAKEMFKSLSRRLKRLYENPRLNFGQTLQEGRKKG